MNATMLAVALPDIRRDFGISHNEVAWLVSSYLIAMAVSQPLGGRIGDQIGRAKAFRLGLIAFMVASLACAAAPNFASLVAFRTLQALFGAAVLPNATAMLRTQVPERRLGQTTGITGAAIGLAAGLGPVLGSVLLQAGSWRWLFLVNLPLVAGGLIALQALRYRDTASGRSVALDLPGALSLAGALVCLTLLFDSAGDFGVVALALVGTGMVAFGTIFVRRQRMTATPMAEWRLFRNRSFFGSTFYVLLSNLAMYTTLLTVPFFVKDARGGSDETSGALLGSMSLLVILLAPATGRFADRIGRRLPALFGGVCQLAAFVLLLAGISGHVSYVYLGVCLALFGFGMGLGSGPAMTAAIEAPPRELAGVAAGTLSMMRYLGSIVGTVVLGAILTGDSVSISVFRLIFAVLVGVSVLTTLSGTMIHRFVERPAGELIVAETG